MREVFLGEYIKQKRLELNLTQEQLCEGICEAMTISRIENGKQTPSRNKINALLQRLGLPGDRYFALLSKNEMKIDDLQKEIISCNIHHEKEKGLKKIQELEKIIEEDDNVTRQFILRSKVLLGKPDGEYSFEEKLNILMNAICLTVPRFDLGNINKCIYSIDEVKLINLIASIYAKDGQHKKAVDILSQLLKYIQKHYQNILQSNGLLPMVALNYAIELASCKRHENAIEIAELGWQSCVKYGHYQFLPGVMAVKAECYFFLKNYEESKKLYEQAYYVYKAIDNQKEADKVKLEAKERLGMEFKF